jgi:uncharacterized membrane protein
MVLESLIVLGDELFCADDARIGKVPCTVFETVNLAYLKISFFLFLWTKPLFVGAYGVALPDSIPKKS